MLFIIAIVIVIVVTPIVVLYFVDKSNINRWLYDATGTEKKLDELSKLYTSLEDKEAKSIVKSAIDDMLGTLAAQQKNIKEKEHEALLKKTREQVKKICK